MTARNDPFVTKFSYKQGSPQEGHIAVDQTRAHEGHNPQLLQLMPVDARTVVEVGCSSGALAREYKKLNAGCRYIGIEVMLEYVALAQRHCDSVHQLNIEEVDDAFLHETLAGDCWVFGDTLEHLVGPMEVVGADQAHPA